MLIKNTSEYYISPILATVPDLVHGYSTRKLGDMRKGESRQEFLKLFPVLMGSLVLAQQVHGADIGYLKFSDRIEEFDLVDGLIDLKTKRADAVSHVLGVRVADCTPLLAVDPVAHVVGAAHAGWQGTKAGISANLVKAMCKTGAKPGNILVSIGPRIGMCCYNVPKERANMFKNYHDDRVVTFADNNWYLDVGYVNYLQLLGSGVSKNNIDAPPICTACQNNEFFSYRRDTKETFGEMLGFIGFNS